MEIISFVASQMRKLKLLACLPVPPWSAEMLPSTNTKFPHVSVKEMEKIRETSYQPEFFEVMVESLNQTRETEKMKGREHVRAGPLVQVLSAQVESDKVAEDKPLAIYGTIYSMFLDHDNEVKVHYLYNRGPDNPEILSSSRILTLTGPADTCHPFNVCKLLVPNTILAVDIWDADQKDVLARGIIIMKGETEVDNEQIRREIVRGKCGSLNVCYIVMPLAVMCRLEVQFYNKESDEDTVAKVDGKIVALYRNTNDSNRNNGDKYVACKLFEKRSDEFEELAIDKPKTLRLSRCWLSLPAYSSPILHLDLSVFHTQHNVINRDIELRAQNSWLSDEVFMVDDVFMKVNVAWFPHYPQPPGQNALFSYRIEQQRDELVQELLPQPEEFAKYLWDMTKEMPLYDESSFSTSPRTDGTPKEELYPSPSLEVYSLFIGRENTHDMRLFGTIEASFGDRWFYIFRRQEYDAFELTEYSETAPILDGYRVYDDDCSIVMKFDLKNVECNLFIRGYVDWSFQQRDSYPSWYDKQLCSVIQGEHGFVAVHYTIFSSAVQAEMKVHCKPKKDGSFYVYGSIVAQYDGYDYSTPYKKQYYRTMLFNRSKQDGAALADDGSIPLSRSIVVVPSNSKLVLDVDLSFISPSSGLTSKFLRFGVKIEIGVTCLSLETEDCLVDIFVNWSGDDLFDKSFVTNSSS